MLFKRVAAVSVISSERNTDAYFEALPLSVSGDFSLNDNAAIYAFPIFLIESFHILISKQMAGQSRDLSRAPQK